MVRSFFERLPKNARGWVKSIGTALMVCGAIRIYGLAGTAEMQDAAGLPGMSTAVLLRQLALDLCLILAGYIARRSALRAPTPKKSAKRAALFSAALPR